jgi:hypothetical protein
MLKRVRGMLLRLVRARFAAFIVGLTLAGPAAWAELRGGSNPWWVDGLSLIVGATGVALMWAGLTGARPDWVDQ